MDGYEIKELRKKLKMKQIEFAKLIGVNRMSVSAWENGKCKPCSLALEKINKIKEENSIENKKFV